MALVKPIQDNAGATYEYWRICDVHILPVSPPRAIVTLAGYVSAETRLDGLDPGPMRFGFDLIITNEKLSSPVSASTRGEMYMAMATVFYEAIKQDIAKPWIAPPLPPDPDPLPDGWAGWPAPIPPAPHPLADAKDG